jgi:hypothetical protein
VTTQDRETEPRFVGPPSSRGDFGGAPRGGYGGGGSGGGGGYGGGAHMGGGGGAPRQLYISNVCNPSIPSTAHYACRSLTCFTASIQCWLARLEGPFPTVW